MSLKDVGLGIGAAIFFVVGYHPRARPHLVIKPMRGKLNDLCAMFIASCFAVVFIVGVVRLVIELV